MFPDSDIVQYFPITCPNTPCDSLAAALKEDETQNNFCLLDHLSSASDDEFYEQTIVTINKCRSFLKSNDGNVEDLKKYLAEGTDKGDEENFFRPVLEDDAFLIFIDDLEDLMENREGHGNENGNGPKVAGESANAGGQVQGDSVEQLQMKIKALEEQVTKSSAYIAKLVDGENSDSGSDSGSDSEDEGQSKKTSSKAKGKGGQDNDSYYFSSYSHSSIHATMLQDTVRTEAYQNAILENPHIFKDKVVMDIGCGTGILSLFAAKAGAKKVIAIDASDMYKEARDIVSLNGYDNIIHVVHGKLEDLMEKNRDKLPLEDGELVDVIISEWMGYGLFFETMLPSVMVARDGLMKKVEKNSNATMWPNRSIVFLEGASDKRLEYWSNVYGMNMAPMKDREMNELRREAGVEIVGAADIVTDRAQLIVHDLNSCRDEELDFEVPFELKPMFANTGDKSVKIDKFVISFDIDFDIPGSKPISFSTGCQTTPTHWKQTTVWFNPNDAPVLDADNGEFVKGIFRMGRNDVNHRDMDILVRWEVGSINKENGTFRKRCEGVIVSKLGA